jgi:rod shape determining protein RodA
VHYFGITVNGAKRWLSLGVESFRFQPSEFMKIAMVVALATYLSNCKDRGKPLGVRGLLFPLAVVALPFYIIHSQPDLGTALHIGLTAVPVLLIRRVRTWILASVIAISLVAGSWLCFFDGMEYLLDKEVIKVYHFERYKTFLDPEKDATGKGWQITQSKSAIGSGQIIGRGFHEGSQQKYGFLPASETDFAFSALAEEWGFVGAAGLLLLYFGLLWFAMAGVGQSGDMFGSLLSVGLAGLLFFQIAINVAMVTGLLPVVGIPLPFMSYGGTSTVMNIMCVAVVLNVGMRRFQFMEVPVRQNPAVWERPASVALGIEPILSVRRIPVPEDDPTEPDYYPAHRKPRREPWLKHLAGKSWQPVSPH